MFGRRRRRRRARREPAGWLGRYMPTAPGREWARCRVLDVSTGGAGLELLGPGAQLGDRIVVDLQLVRSNMARISLTGEVRHVRGTPSGTRVGVKFVDVGELEQALLQRLVARQKHQRRHPDVVVPLTTSRAWE